MTPEGWTQTTIGDICSFSSGNGFRPPDWSDDGLPIIRIQNLNGSKDFNYFAGEPDFDWIVEPGTILFAWAGTRGASFGPTVWSGPKGVLNQHIFRVTPKVELDRGWLYSILEMITKQIEQRAHGFKSTLLHVHKGDITGQEIPLPPLAEQRQIAAILSTWDEAITRTTQLIAALQRRKQALMQLLLTGALRFPGFENSEWEELPLNELVDPVSRTESVNPESEYKLIGVRWYVAGVHIHEVIQGSEIITSSLSRVQKQDIVYNKMWTTKAAFGIAKEAHDGAYGTSEYPQFVAKKNKLETNYLEYVFHDPTFQYQAITLCRGSTGRARLNPSDFLKIIIDIPVIPEQRKIADFLQSCDKEIATYNNQLLRLQTQKRGLMQQLLTGAVRVPQTL